MPYVPTSLPPTPTFHTNAACFVSQILGPNPRPPQPPRRLYLQPPNRLRWQRRGARPVRCRRPLRQSPSPLHRRPRRAPVRKLLPLAEHQRVPVRQHSHGQRRRVPECRQLRGGVELSRGQAAYCRALGDWWDCKSTPTFHPYSSPTISAVRTNAMRCYVADVQPPHQPRRPPFLPAPHLARPAMAHLATPRPPNSPLPNRRPQYPLHRRPTTRRQRSQLRRPTAALPRRRVSSAARGPRGRGAQPWCGNGAEYSGGSDGVFQ